MSAAPRWWPVGRGSGRLRVDLDPLDDRALARSGALARLALPAAVVVVSLVIAGVLAIVNPGLELGPVEGPPPVGPVRDVRLDLATIQELSTGPARPPLAETPTPGLVVDTFDGPLDAWQAAAPFSAVAGQLAATGPGALLPAGDTIVGAAEIELSAGTPEAGLILQAGSEAWTWTAGPAGLRVTHVVDGEQAVVWSGQAPTEGRTNGAPRLAVRRTASGLDLEAGGRLLLRVATALPAPDVSAIGVVVRGQPATGASTAVATRVTLVPAP